MLPEIVEEVEETTEERMDGALDSLRRELSGIHAGRMTPALLEGVKADYYGNPTPIPQMATVSAPEPQLLVINPWEKSALKEIERALQGANLGFGISSDGNVIRATMPPLTEERRLEQVKQVKRVGEENKVSIRSVRRDSNETLKKMEKEKIISQDEQKATEANVQELTNRHIGQVDELVSAKEQELLND